MNIEAINELLHQHFPNSEIETTAEGSHLQLKMISAAFEGLSTLKKQQKVYGVLNDKIASGEIHAVKMTLSSPNA